MEKKAKKKMSGGKEKLWGFFIYIAGDNNLSDAGLEDIQELCKEGASEQVHVGVEIDTYGEHTGSIRYDITERDWTNTAYRTVIERLPEKDTGDPETLLSFAKWCLDRYRAKNHIMVVWNHGSGFRSTRRDIGYDDFGSSLDMPEIESAFTRAGIGPNSKLGILGFDACLMNMIEIAHHFKDQVEILVGSQQTEPGDGWPYDEVLKKIKESNTNAELAKKIVDAYIKSYKDTGVFDVTQSAVQTSKTEKAISDLSKLGSLLAKNMDKYRSKIDRVRLASQNFAMADYVDLVHLAKLISKQVNDKSISDAAKAVVDSTTACVLASGTLGKTVKNANGVSVWFPAYGNTYYNYRAKYLMLKCNENNFGWLDFLDAYHSR